MFPVMHQYKLRLTNLSQSNRSLKLGKLSVRKDMDLADLGFLNGMSAEEILGKIVAGQNVTVMRSLSSRDEATNIADRRLNNLYHEVNTIYEETGTDDLFIGYPFVEGKFLDGSIARCPLVLIPIQLVRNFQGSPRWVLKPNNDEDLGFNTTFFLAYEKFMQARLGKEFWEEAPERHGDLQGFLNGLYKLLQDHQITLHFNSELFQFKLERFMDKNQALLDQLELGKLRLLPNAVLGIFPQSDSALLQDYEVLEREPQAFGLEDFFRPKAPLSQLPVIKEDERYFVSTVDQSQEEALIRVHAGESMVLHGPPGTGKSQVILNLISDALAQGKRVLVCSQKRAALDVVFQRMSEVGLGRFGALVHDYRADRNKIFARIRQQLDDLEAFETERDTLGLDTWLRDFRQDSRRLDEYNEFFDRMHMALSVPGRIGYSAHELYLLADPRKPQVDMEPVAQLFDKAAWLAFREKLSSILDYEEFFDESHPWSRHLPLHRIGFAGKTALAAAISRMSAAIDDLDRRWQAMAGPGKTLGGIEACRALLPAFAELEQLVERPNAKADIAAAWQDRLSPDEVAKHLHRLDGLFQAMATFELLDDFPLNWVGDLQRHIKNYLEKAGSPLRFFSLDWLKGRWYIKKVISSKGKGFDLVSVAALQKEAETLAQLLAISIALDKYAFFKDIPLTNGAAVLMAWATRKRSSMESLSAVQAFVQFQAFQPRPNGGQWDEAQWTMMRDDAAQAGALVQVADALVQEWSAWLHPDQIQHLLAVQPTPSQALAYAVALKETFEGQFDDLCQLDALMESLVGVQCIAIEHLRPHAAALGRNPKAGLLAAIDNGLWLAWLSILEGTHPELAEASSRQMPERMGRYRNLVQQRTSTVAGLIQRKLKDAILDNIEYNRLNNPVTYRDIAHQVRKQRQLWPVRKLVQTFWDEGLSRVMPCWLASPESVAAIFPMVRNYFDLVVFDEASQCYVERALPVMLRGKQCVIAGDDQQLQPFDLYNVKVEELESDTLEEQMSLEVESILDLARNIYPQGKLNWHYRSTEKALIDFSNFAFYEGRLHMASPAQTEEISNPPIAFLRVEGRWDQNRNEVEARKVVDIVEQLVRHPDNPTIGVVTFNFHQKELIRELLELKQLELGMAGDQEAAARLHKAMERIEGEERQGIFVKNIENVQGDERDVIIFSVGYARNKEGKLIANFGLLNQKGGGNRLNVAITRAKKKKIVVCSVDPEDLSVENAKYDGPRLLKRYLQYARAVQGADHAGIQAILQQLRPVQEDKEETLGSIQGRLAAHLEAMLVQKGWKVVRNVGDHNFVLELALQDSSGRFVLGIDCEGASYFSGRSAKEREVYRPSLLAQRGWSLYRLWARNYFLDPERELQRIIAAATPNV